MEEVDLYNVMTRLVIVLSLLLFILGFSNWWLLLLLGLVLVISIWWCRIQHGESYPGAVGDISGGATRESDVESSAKLGTRMEYYECQNDQQKNAVVIGGNSILGTQVETVNENVPEVQVKCASGDVEVAVSEVRLLPRNIKHR